MPNAGPQTIAISGGSAITTYAITGGAKRYTTAELAAFSGIAIIAGMAAEDGPCARGLELIFFGTGTENTTFSVRVYQRKFGRSGTTVDHALELLGTVACTLSSLTGAASGLLLGTSDRYVDTITWTPATAATSPAGIMDQIEDRYGATVGAYSPANNTPAKLFLTDVGHGDIVLDFDMTGATSGNAIYQIVRS